MTMITYELCAIVRGRIKGAGVPNILHSEVGNTKRKTDSGRKSGYYAAILSRGLWSVSTAKQFASSLSQRGLQVSLFASVSISSS